MPILLKREQKDARCKDISYINLTKTTKKKPAPIAMGAGSNYPKI